jgi:DMSO reductase anchor subunit/ferredoxin
MNGCPVLAYEKNTFTGIVKHLDDQCIGCQYCVLMCPYDVPKYNPSRGIVRKCDMCSSRLEAHEAPACVQGCPTSAIRITIVDTAEAHARAENDQFLPASPDPRHTVPTTRYIRSQPFPDATRAANAPVVRPAGRHAPLVFMLVLTQLSVGLFFTGLLDRIVNADAVAADYTRTSSLLALSAAAFGLNIALLHLGKPLYAFRAVLGLKRSWMSREIVVFGLFGAFATAFTFVCGGAAGANGANGAAEILEWLTVLAGFAGVFCSAMIYVDTQRECWAFARTAPLFILTTLLLGASSGMVIAALHGGSGEAWFELLCRAVIGVTVVKLALELSVLGRREAGPMARTVLLLTTQLRSTLALRVLAGLTGGIVLPMLLLQNHDASAHAQTMALLSYVLLIAGELLERMLFFQSAATAAMPGALTT